MAITINGNGTITGISVGGLPNGIVDTDMIAANAVTSAKASGLGGLSMCQQWKTTSIQTLNSGYVTLNTWQAVGHAGAGSLGTGLTHNSGTFSFPSTGIYHLSAIGTFNDQTNNQDFMNLGFNITTDGSNFTRVLQITGSITQNPNYEAIAAEYILDVTNVSDVKFQVTAQDQHGSGRLFGETGTVMSSLTVMKLGDT